MARSHGVRATFEIHIRLNRIPYFLFGVLCYNRAARQGKRWSSADVAQLVEQLTRNE